MRNLSKLFVMSVLTAASFGFFGVASAAGDMGRSAYNVRSSGRGSAFSRMPSMPVVPPVSYSTDLPTGSGATSSSGGGGMPDISGGDNGGDDNSGGENKKESCPTDYTVEKCMNDLLLCVNTGALPGGINDMFDPNLRNAIVNGMNLCGPQVDRCISDVHEWIEVPQTIITNGVLDYVYENGEIQTEKECMQIYNTPADVWLDFNTRKVQPAYYEFVLRKTGLSPNQAKNTCLLLDTNVYGESFNAVASNNRVSSEYAKPVGTYNNQESDVWRDNNGNIMGLVKPNPLGPVAAGSYIDFNRGYYARWDPKNADCLIRVAAYYRNKNEPVSDKWLGLGSNKTAEVWKKTGETFTCNKDLFGFSLMRNTKGVALIGLPVGTAAGAGIGAAASHGARELKCDDLKMREKISKNLKASGKLSMLNHYLYEPISEAKDESSTNASSATNRGNKLTMADPTKILPTDATISQGQCEDIVRLYNVYNEYVTKLAECTDESKKTTARLVNVALKRGLKEGEDPTKALLDEVHKISVCASAHSSAECATLLSSKCADTTDNDDCLKLVKALANGNENIKFTIAYTTETKTGCWFKPLDRTRNNSEMGVVCTEECPDCKCVNREMTQIDVNNLTKIFDEIGLPDLMGGEKSNRGKGIGIGAATGLGAAGLATGITALVEKSNIHCRVGDQLGTVKLGKSFTIDTLKDFYVKYKLNLPDTISPTPMVKYVTDCESWKRACAVFKDLTQCNAAAINYEPQYHEVQYVEHACINHGSQCFINLSVAQNYGVCSLVTPNSPLPPSPTPSPISPNPPNEPAPSGSSSL